MKRPEAEGHPAAPSVLLDRAENAFRAGDEAGALRLVDQAYERDPALRDGFARLGGIQREARNWKAARSLLEMDRTLHRLSSGWTLRLAEVLAELDETARAERLVLDVYRAHPEARDGFARLGGVFLRRQDWPEAVRWMRKDLRRHRLSVHWQGLYALTAERGGHFSTALSLLKSASPRDASLCDLGSRIGWLLRKRQDWKGARAAMQMDFAANAMSIDWQLSYARLLGETGQRARALGLLDGIAARGTLRQMSPKTIVHYGETLYFLDQPGLALRALEAALVATPEHTQPVLAAIADFQMRSTVNHWLQAGIKAIPHPPRHRPAGAPAPSRPDWAAVETAYRRARSAGVHFRAPEDLRKRVLAQLFLSDELVQAGRIDEGEVVLRAGLQTTVPAWPADSAHAVSSCILEQATSRMTKAEAVGRIEQELDRIRPLPDSHEWLVLNDVLLWHGFFSCGHQAWQHARECALIKADRHANDADRLHGGFRAAMIGGDYSRAGHLLIRLQAVAPARVPDARAYLDLHVGRLDSARAFWQSGYGQSDQRLADYLRDKTVAIAGPAPTGEPCGERIDSHDVVIRTCYTGFDPDTAAECGRRTHMSNYAPSWVLGWTLGRDHAYLADLDFYTFGHILHVPPFVARDLHARKAHPVCPNPHLFHKNPMAIARILHDVLRFSPARVSLFKSTFYVSRQAYRATYQRSMPEAAGSQDAARRKQARISVIWAHDYLSQWKYVRNLWKAGVIDIDDRGRDVLAMSDHAYMAALDEFCG